MDGAPGWLNTVSLCNPMRYIVDAMREVFQGYYFTQGVAIGAVVGVLLAMVSVAVCAKAFVRDNA